MTVATHEIKLETQGHAHMLNITERAAAVVRDSGLTAGIVTLFVPGATAALTTIEYEDGALHDFQRLFDELASPKKDYQHNLAYGDGNGHSHVRAALLGPSLTVPFRDGALMLGTWQRILFVDFDNRPRSRTLIAQVMGESHQ